MGVRDAIDRDKIDRFKKDREVRRRGSSVEETWRRLEREGNLSVKDKLEKLIRLTGGAGPTPAPPRPRHIRTREPFQYFENSYGLDVRYGKNRIGEGLEVDGRTLFYLSRDEEFQGLDLSSALFFDLETTGLAGGTGTLPFLVGLGFYRDDKFVVAQYFLGDPGEEERMLEELARLFEDGGFRSVVTYNGKAFDVPLLETRFILQRRKYVLSDWPHLDFLFSARTLWKHKHESCRLFHLAREVVAADRSEDIPGAEIPQRYFDYLRSGDFELIEPILYHNQEDILSLLGLVVSGAKMFRGEGAAGEGEDWDAMDLVGVGRVFETAGEVERSVALFERALSGGLPAGVEVALKEKISFHFKRAKRWDKAVPLWKDLSEKDDAFISDREIKGILVGLRQLAIHYERHEKKPADALRAAEEGLAMSQKVAGRWREEFEARIDRLKSKLLAAKR